MTQPATEVSRVVSGASHVDLVWAPDGRSTRLPSYWLKLHAAPCNRYAGVAARWTDGANFLSDDVPVSETDRIAAAEIVDRDLEVTWCDGTTARMSLADIWREAADADEADVLPVLWNAATAIPEFEYERVFDSRDERELHRFLRAFLQYGLAFLNNVPRRHDQVAAVAARVSTVQPSHLGPIFTMVHADEPRHLGETSHDIPLHIDMVYKETPPDLQMLHVLEPADAGGENIFVDAFTVVSQLDPQDVRRLRDAAVWFVADSDAVHFRGRHPLIAVDAAGHLRGLYYNDYKVVFPSTTPSEVYFAFKRLQDAARRPQNARVVGLRRDSIVLLHNRRTLHGRRAFRGRRHVTGCYLSEDDLKSRYRVLARRLQNGDAGEG